MWTRSGAPATGVSLPAQGPLKALPSSTMALRAKQSASDAFLQAYPDIPEQAMSCAQETPPPVGTSMPKTLALLWSLTGTNVIY